MMTWTDDDKEWMREHYADTSCADIAEYFGTTVNAVQNMANRMRLRKSAAYIQKISLSNAKNCEAYRYVKGHVPDNKGKKMSPEVYKKVSAGFFKKGAKAPNVRPVGSERVNTEGYIEVKVNARKWMLKQRLVWEKYNGVIKPGYCIIFRDGNKQNCDISNLGCITRAELALTYGVQKYGKEIVSMVQLKGILTRYINNNKNQEKQ